MIGDSHTVGAFGSGLLWQLDKEKTILDQDIAQFAVTGSTIWNWQAGSFENLSLGFATKLPLREKQISKGGPDSWSLTSLLKSFGSESVLIALGTNDMAKGTPPDVEKFLQILNGRRCLWILPPLINNIRFSIEAQELFYNQLKDSASRRGCQVIDSRLIRDHSNEISDSQLANWQNCIQAPGEKLIPDENDHIHFTTKKGRYWGRCVASAVRALLKGDSATQ